MTLDQNKKTQLNILFNLCKIQSEQRRLVIRDGRESLKVACRLLSLQAHVSWWQAPDFHHQMKWLPVEVRGSRDLNDRWLGSDMKHGLTYDDKSIKVGEMKHAQPIPDVYDCAGFMPRLRDWLNGCLALCVFSVSYALKPTHTHTQPLVILTENF